VTAELTAAECQLAAGHCITCGDEGIPMRILECEAWLALCADASGELHQVAVDLISPVSPGEELLVHAGVAIGRLGGSR
jgi:hydrogenase maturation factor